MGNKLILGGVIVLLGIILLGGYYYMGSQEEVVLINTISQGVLTVGTNTPYEPMEYVDENGMYAGYDIDVIKNIAKNLGLTVVFKEYVWEELFESLSNKEVDVIISAITITSERSESMLFSIPYFNGGQSIVVKKTNTDIISEINLESKKIAVGSGTIGEDEAKKYTSSDLVIGFDDIELAFDSLIADEVDAVIVDYIVASVEVGQHEELKLAGEPFTQEYYGIATSLENRDLIENINYQIREMTREGDFSKLQVKWFTKDS